MYMTTFSVLSSLDDLTPCHCRETNRAMYTLGFKVALFMNDDVTAFVLFRPSSDRVIIMASRYAVSHSD